MALDFEDRHGEVKLPYGFSSQGCPDAHFPVRACAGHSLTILAPAEGAHGMDVARYDLGYASGSEVPDANASVVTADCKKCPLTIKGAGQGDADTIQHTLMLLKERKPLLHNLRHSVLSASYINDAAAYHEFKSV